MATEPIAQIGQANAQAIEPAPRWRLGTRIAFRFAFAYLVLYIFPFPLGTLPYTAWPAQKYQTLWDKVVPWVGKHVLHLGYSVAIAFTGSGDRTYDYIQVLCFLLLAAFVTVVWSLVDRRRTNYSELYRWLRFYVRITLASTMIGYGSYKVIQSQFPAPTLLRLLEPYGQSSPMALLWTLMGASKSYNLFTGLIEMTGGVLVIIPRFTTLGSLVLVGAISNVFVLNMSYDVPVKQYSFHLLLMCLFVVAPDLRRLAGFFVFNRGTEPASDRPLFKRRRLNQGALALQLVLGALFMRSGLHSSYQQARTNGYLAPKPALYGIWFVDQFAVDQNAHAPLVTDDIRWQRVVFDVASTFAVEAMSGSFQFLRVAVDTKKRTLLLEKFDDSLWMPNFGFVELGGPQWKTSFAFDQPAPDRIMLDGEFEGRRVQAELHRETPKFLLTSRGFHWINEYPLAR